MFVNLFKNILNIIIQSNTYKNHRQELKRSKTGNFLKKIGVIEVHIIPIFEKKNWQMHSSLPGLLLNQTFIADNFLHFGLTLLRRNLPL